MTVFLTSSPTGPLDGSRPVHGVDELNGLRENLRRRWKPAARVLLVSADPGNDAFNDRVRGDFEYLLGVSEFSCSTVDSWDDRTAELSAGELCRYDVLLLGGGHVPTQNAFFGRIRLREKLQDFRGIVIGISAGSMNCAETVYAQPEEAGESVDPAYRRFLPGLGLTRVNVLPHLQMLRDTWLDGRRLFEDITFADSYGREFLAIPDGSYLLLENGITTLFGEGWRIAEGDMTQICGAGECIRL